MRVVAVSFVVVLLATVLTACPPPAATAAIERQNGTVEVLVTAGEEQAFRLVSVTVIGEDLATEDPRCREVETALSCDLGSLEPNEQADSILVAGEDVSCTAAGYVGPGIGDYRVVRCTVMR